MRAPCKEREIERTEKFAKKGESQPRAEHCHVGNTFAPKSTITSLCASGGDPSESILNRLTQYGLITCHLYLPSQISRISWECFQFYERCCLDSVLSALHPGKTYPQGYQVTTIYSLPHHTLSDIAVFCSP